MTGANLNNALLDFVEALNGATTATATGDQLMSFAKHSGAVVAHAFLGMEKDSFRATTLPDWVIEQEGSEFARTKSHVPDAVLSGTPVFYWGKEIDKGNSRAKPAGILVGEERFRLFKQRNAVSFALPSKDGSFSGAGVGLGYEERLTSFKTRMNDICGALSVASYAANCRILKLLEDETEQSPLSPRQTEILQYLGQGLQLGAIADKLGVADSTINLHLSQLKKKLSVRTKEQALALALTKKWIEV